MFIPRTKYISIKRLRQLERNSGSKEYQNWRNCVLARDGNKCSWPGCREIDNLEIHHIKRFTDAKHLKHAVYNGITLCAKHHGQITGREEGYELFLSKIVISTEKQNKLKENQEKNAKTDNDRHSGTDPT